MTKKAKVVVVGAELVGEVVPGVGLVVAQPIVPVEGVVAPVALEAAALPVGYTDAKVASKYAAKQISSKGGDWKKALGTIAPELEENILSSFPEDLLSGEEFSAELRALESEGVARDEGKALKGKRRVVLAEIDSRKKDLVEANKQLVLHQRRIAIYRQTAREALTTKVPAVAAIYANMDALSSERKAEFLQRIEAAIHESTLKLHWDDILGEIQSSRLVDDLKVVIANLEAHAKQLDQDANDAFTFAAEIRAQAGLAPRVRKGGDEN